MQTWTASSQHSQPTQSSSPVSARRLMRQRTMRGASIPFICSRVRGVELALLLLLPGGCLWGRCTGERSELHAVQGRAAWCFVADFPMQTIGQTQRAFGQACGDVQSVQASVMRTRRGFKAHRQLSVGAAQVAGHQADQVPHCLPVPVMHSRVSFESPASRSILYIVMQPVRHPGCTQHRAECVGRLHGRE